MTTPVEPVKPRIRREMTHEEIRAMLDRSLAQAWEIHERAEARRAAELAALANAARDAAPPRRTLSAPRIGPRMRELADIVSAMPGITKSDALRAAGLPVRGMGSGRQLTRAICAGLILVEHERANLCRLFASERDRKRWHLARDLLTPGTSAGRVAEIRAEITVLDAERAATWSLS
jgi:hypothetical protein